MSGHIPFLDLRPTESLRTEIDAAYRRVINSGRFLFGEEVDKFESMFSEFQKGESVDTYYSIAVNSGYDALRMAIMASNGYSPYQNDEKIAVPINAPIPVWMAIIACGAKPLPIRVDYDTYNINTILLESAISSEQVVAAIAVHLYGRPVDRIDIMADVAYHFGINLIEDCSQAHGARFFGFGLGDTGTNVGSFGDFAVYSFYPTKNMGAFGDAGVVVTRRKSDEELLRKFRFYGMGEMYGINSRMDELQAAFLQIKLSNLDNENKVRRKNALYYLNNLVGIPNLVLPLDYPGHVWHQFVIRHTHRDKLRKYLMDNQVDTVIHYPEIPPSMLFFRSLVENDYKQDARILADQVLSLPIGSHLNQDDLSRICDLIRSFSR